MRSLHRWKGQTIIIVALGAVALMSLVALAVDGGSALLQRRNMQNGADAAALGAIKLIQRNMTVDCNDSGSCWPQPLVTYQQVRDKVMQFVNDNTGGVIGTAAPDAQIEYHLTTGGYDPEGTLSSIVESHVDGVRVTANIGNPTTFARVININTIAVSAVGAARISPTCRTDSADGTVLPFTRFRPFLEQEMQQQQACNLFSFWTSQPDIQGGFKNSISINQNYFTDYPSGPPVGNQEITTADTRNGPAPPGVGGNFHANGTIDNCTSDPTTWINCADMRGHSQDNGTQTHQDVENWIYWKWAGLLSYTTTHPQDGGPLDYGGIYQPSSWRTEGGTTNNCCTYPTADPLSNSENRHGDWAEVFQHGDTGQNIENSLYNLAVNPPPPAQPQYDGMSTRYNWGPYVDRIIFVWGDPNRGTLYPSNNSAQVWRRLPTGNCGPPLQTEDECHWIGWEDLTIDNRGNNNWTISNQYDNSQSNTSVDRVHLTYFYKFRFYANLQGHPGAIDPGCGLPNTTGNDKALGYLLPPDQGGGPPDPTCSTWQRGGGSTGGSIDPGAP
ncbi:MAG TPA: pilus assembly protein TadG-related protein [Chloroflexia bacterium]|nr:pilus assembly protein TadG-related protein [Chloroflexia bacterium]